MPMGTLIALTGLTLPNASARDLTVDLSPIASGELARDVNGNLVDMTLPQFRKYAVTLSCTDLKSPELTGIWRGQPVSMTLIAGLGLGDIDDEQVTLALLVDGWQAGRQERLARTAWSITFLQV